MANYDINCVRLSRFLHRLIRNAMAPPTHQIIVNNGRKGILCTHRDLLHIIKIQYEYIYFFVMSATEAMHKFDSLAAIDKRMQFFTRQNNKVIKATSHYRKTG